jgi:WD40 repeat protein
MGTRPHAIVLMATPRYVLDTTLPTGHSNSITALRFSPDGGFLASGSGDGVLMIFSTSMWKPVKRFVDASSVTAVVWHPTFPKTLICGYGSGDVHTMNFESHSLVSTSLYQPHQSRSYQQVDDCHRVWTDRLGGPVHNLALDKTGARVALSYGSDVAVVEQHAICGLKFASGEDDGSTNRDSCLDECTKSP